MIKKNIIIEKEMTENNQHIVQLLLKHHSIDVSPFDETFLEKSLQKRIAVMNCLSQEEYFIFLQKNKKEGIRFSHSLFICYSEFFRNPLTFAFLERLILPSLIAKKIYSKQKEIRIWCAACAAGQEAYSLAMLLEENKNGNANKFNYRIFATDQSQQEINEAQKGHYSDSAIKNLTIKRFNKWFIKHGNNNTIIPELKTHIDFSVFDLFNPQLSAPPASIFGDFDLVICANLLFYYKPEYRKTILSKINKCLAREGFLITGETERDILSKNNYKEVYLHSGIFQKKQQP